MSDKNTPSSPEEVVLSIVKNAHSSFYSAMRLLPFHQRMAMFAVYAFCREIDDIADEPAPLETKKKGLAVWRNDIELTYAGMPPSQNPVAVALSPFIRAYDLPKEEFMALIDGMESDLPDDMRAPTLGEVELYCRRVAGAVGVLSVHIFGDASPAARAARIFASAPSIVSPFGSTVKAIASSAGSIVMSASRTHSGHVRRRPFRFGCH